MYIRLPVLMRFFGLTDAFSFHLPLARVLEKRAGAARDFRRWPRSNRRCNRTKANTARHCASTRRAGFKVL